MTSLRGGDTRRRTTRVKPNVAEPNDSNPGTGARPAATRATKRKHDNDDIDRPTATRGLKKAKVEPTINQPPTEVLAILVFGNGDGGELGLGPAAQEASRPRLNQFLNPSDPSALRVVQLACGGMHTIGLTEVNRIVTWGVNDNYALGRSTAWDGGLRDVDGDSEEDGELNPLESTPTPIPTQHFPPGTRFVQVAAGDSCSFALTDAGAVYGWGTFKNSEGKERFGYDANGQAIEKQPTPTQIAGLSNITQVTCGANHALALDVNGAVWAWGCNEQNQLGRHDFGRHARDSLTPDRVRIRDIKHIACGDYHSLAVDKKDQVWAWGLNSFGQAGYAKAAGSDEVLLPFPMRIPGLRGKGVVSLAGGAHHSAAVTADGQCLVWGRLDGGQLGITFSPEQLEDATVIRHDERGRPRICLRPTAVPGIGEVSHVACGPDHTIFVTRKGTAYATGFNSQGQLGLGHEDDVEAAQLIQGKALKDRALTWAGAGGQFSMVAARSKSSPAEGS
ncbi:regulator of chromosome condensation 1/beta-lactamase-inhibitor protein II [Chaetomium fimeti]|uniref:Regulator of chromosome condensation 1/beta-lactamase-inhibitor protein II n=1 Tax=Chaetomium fimeti TaxID=1854472 RepID=A0AAE0HLZ3_9PEZI|nr:regulator of chromosome condensation 1/beta-lactamase-inhibitor protein II [Chaetomium fimeti]